jgi:hypothetical protein
MLRKHEIVAINFLCGISSPDTAITAFTELVPVAINNARKLNIIFTVVR